MSSPVMSAPLIYRRDVVRRHRHLDALERQMIKPGLHWFRECFAEALGVFFYVYAGVSSTAGFVVGNIISKPLGSFEQIGFAYMLGILLAITICASTSGGHFSPGVTISQVIFNKFPPLKGLRYIVSQILGAYLACALIYTQWHYLITVSTGALVAAKEFDSVMFTPNGPAGIFALYLLPGQGLARVFLNEAACTFFVGVITWACIDPSNILITPQIAPFIISAAYGVAIWGFGIPGIALNTARDVGGRLWAISVYGLEASGGRYAAIAALTNIPVLAFAFVVYEIMLADSDRAISSAHGEFIHILANHRRLFHAEHHGKDTESSKRDSEKPSLHTYDAADKTNHHV